MFYFRSFMREMWRKMCNLRLLCETLHIGPYLWRVQLWLLSGKMCNLRWSWNLWRLLLQRMYNPGEGPGRVSKNCQPGKLKNWSLLWNEKVWVQKKVMRCSQRYDGETKFCTLQYSVLISLRHFLYLNKQLQTSMLP